jgi:hypothetical protein
VREQLSTSEGNGAVVSTERGASKWSDALALLVWVLAAVIVFVPFARDISAWDAVTLRVPGNQGNWWHVLVGLPFFLAYPMLWLRVGSVFSNRQPTQKGRRVIWSAVGVAIVGTISVETPFLMHLAGTSEWQRVAILGLGFGVMIVSALILLFRWRNISPTCACIAGLDAAYLANTALCLVVYSEATGTIWSRAGWLVSMVIVWPIAFDLILLLRMSLRSDTPVVGTRVA